MVQDSRLDVPVPIVRSVGRERTRPEGPIGESEKDRLRNGCGSRAPSACRGKEKNLGAALVSIIIAVITLIT